MLRTTAESTKSNLAPKKLYAGRRLYASQAASFQLLDVFGSYMMGLGAN